ncbi:hypothetical protein BRY73_23915 [Ochrobactrum sp. P6BS-III]|uniref:hypothetical protein n=1 Tax=unclassified Ochrobactrum TaxID=239106 RepID=UPI00099247C6|nr:hypothetical protein [Ochrobactrum sp. P6BSIII]OOL14273.1 hypothetical protein BRY73_23915 [Ochrobactrum sp. P6BS-III]
MNQFSSGKREFGHAETIAERKARLAYDKAHPWLPVSEASVNGAVCELQFSDMVGHIDSGHRRFVLLGLDRWKLQVWWQINPIESVLARPMSFRETGAKVSDEKLRRLHRLADRSLIGGLQSISPSVPQQQIQDR